MTQAAAKSGADGEKRLPRALDGDELVTAGRAVGRRHAAGDFVVVELAERGGLGEVARLAIGSGDRDPAGRAGGEATVDAVAVRIVGDDESALFPLRGSTEDSARNDERGQAGPLCSTPHDSPGSERRCAQKP